MVRQPAVFGRSVNVLGLKKSVSLGCSEIGPLVLLFAGPNNEAQSVRLIGDHKRLVNGRKRRTVRLIADDEMHDYQFVTLVQADTSVIGFLYNFMIGFDGDLATAQTDSLQQLRHRQGPIETPVFSVDGQARVVGLLFINFIRVFTALRASDRTILGPLSLASITNR